MLSRELRTRPVNANGWRGLVRQGGALDTALREGLWPVTDARLQIRKGRGDAVSGLVQLETDGTTLFFKRFRYRPGGLPLRRLLHRERSSNNWRIGGALWSHGVGTPRPEGWLRHGRETWFLCAAWTDGASLSALTCEPRDLEELAATSLEFVDDIARMHDAGILHRDLKWGNLLLGRNNQRAIIDLDSARQHANAIRGRSAARDLARFLVSGLEAGLTEHWAHIVTERYDRTRALPIFDLSRYIRRAVRRISHEHQRRYGRHPVAAADARRANNRQ